MDQYLLPYCVATTIDHVKRVEGWLAESARCLAEVHCDRASIFCEFPVFQPVGPALLNATDLIDGTFRALSV